MRHMDTLPVLGHSTIKKGGFRPQTLPFNLVNLSMSRDLYGELFSQPITEAQLLQLGVQTSKSHADSHRECSTRKDNKRNRNSKKE